MGVRAMSHHPLDELTQAIGRGSRADATRCTRAAIDAGAPPQAVLDALVAGMDEVGRRFQCNELFVPEMLIASRAMKESLALLEPLLVAAGIKPHFTAVIGTVQGDLHDIGKNLVAMMWKGAHFDVIDLGVNVAPERFADAARAHGARVVGLSALLTTTMPAMKQAISAVRGAAGLAGVKIVVGGAPVTQRYADEVGADGYAPDAAGAVDLVRSLVA
jgi:5-methyltetrahydrofolate--homocysteine methyltransferase